MESLEDKIKKFITLGSGSGYGYGNGYGSGNGYGNGYGSGSGDGYGYGNGDGYGDGYGNGNGDGYGNGNGNGNGYGNGSGDGDGDGYGNGSGDGDGDGYGLLSFLGKKVYYVDGVATCFNSVVGYTAKGFIINNDLTVKDCYIVRVGNSFAHGETLEKAQSDANAKHLQEQPVEGRVKSFLETFKGKEPIPAKDLFDWHFTLTGSCEMGRRQFVKDHNIDLEKDKFTISEFIKLVENSYGKEVIKELKNQYQK